MWILNQTAARALIWLAIISIPAQGLPASSCGCAGSDAGCKESNEARCCCPAENVREERTCCARRKASRAHSCCIGSEREHGSGCTCGLSCQCGKGSQPEPAAPSSDRSTEEELAAAAVSVASAVVLYDQPSSPPKRSACAESQACTALGRCVFLCRFTI